MRTSCVKNGLAVGVILLFIGVALSPVITAFENDKETAENINHDLATITGRVINRFGFGSCGVNVFIDICPTPEESEYYKTVFSNLWGYYSTKLEASEEGITYQIKACIITVDFNGDSSQMEEITVFPSEHYKIPDLILSNWPKNRGSYSSLFLRLFERFPLLEKLLTLIIDV